MYAFPGNPKAIWLTEALPAPLTNSYAPGEFICPITHEVMVDAVWAICSDRLRACCDATDDGIPQRTWDYG